MLAGRGDGLVVVLLVVKALRRNRHESCAEFGVISRGWDVLGDRPRLLGALDLRRGLLEVEVGGRGGQGRVGREPLLLAAGCGWGGSGGKRG